MTRPAGTVPPPPPSPVATPNVPPPMAVQAAAGAPVQVADMPAPIPAPPPMIIPPIPSPRHEIPAAPAGHTLPGGADMGNAPAARRAAATDWSTPPAGPGGSSGGTPAGGYGGQPVPLSPYEESRYQGLDLHRRRRRRTYPIFTALIIAGLAVGGWFVYRHVLAITNPHRSPSAAAEAYITDIGAGNKAAERDVVLPGQALANERGAGNALTFGVSGYLPDGPDVMVNLEVCANLYSGASCTPTVLDALPATVPVRKVGTKWYVDQAQLPLCGTHVQVIVCAPLGYSPGPS